MKKIAVVIDRAPDPNLFELLRMTVGMTIEDENKVSLLLLGDGVFCINRIDEEKLGFDMAKHFEMLKAMKADLYAHTESAEQRNVSLSGTWFQSLDDGATVEILAESDFVVS